MACRVGLQSELFQAVQLAPYSPVVGEGSAHW